MIWILILTVSAIAIWAGIHRASEDQKPKVFPLSDDDLALQAHYLKAEETRQMNARYARESTRRRYEFITWPAILWEDRKRQIEAAREAARITGRDAKFEETA